MTIDDRSLVVERAGEDASPVASPGGVRLAETSPALTTRIELPTRTIFKVVLTLGLLWLLVKLWSLLLLLFVGLLLAAALDPLVTRLERRGWPRSLSVALIVAVLAVVAALALSILVPPVVDEATQFAQNLPAYVDEAQGVLNRNPALFGRLRDVANQGAADPSTFFSGVLRVGAGVVQGITNALLLLVLTVYLLVDGERVLDWVLRYAPAQQRFKVRQALPEISHVVSGYVIGQVITSVLFGLFSFGVVSIAGVPQPLLLALLAAIADAIPIAGILIATVPAALLALTVSLPTAVIVVVAYVAYQQVENYLIVPRVYRDTLRISSFAVLIAVLIGGELLGIIGVLVALPIAAAVPVIERIWRGEPTSGA